MLALDIEVYQNYFLAMFKHIENGEVRYFELYPNHDFNRTHLKTVMEKYLTISFNGLNYDLPLIQAAIEGWDNEALYNLSKTIITSNKPSWTITKQNNIEVPTSWNHIDLIEVAPGTASLKIYGGRMNAPKMQDLPIKPDEEITASMRAELRTYCENDLDTTILLYNTIRPQIALRESMSEQYGIDLRSKSDAQIAEAVIKSELEKKTKRQYRKSKVKDGVTIRYQDPQIVSFNSKELQTTFQKILEHEFKFKGNGAIELPKWLKDTPIIIGGREYSMGIGGLHSNEKAQYIKADPFEILLDLDVQSYYPSIITQQQLAPKMMGQDFLELYQSIVDERLSAKQRVKEIKKEIEELKKQLTKLNA